MSPSPAPIFLIAFIKLILKPKYTQSPKGYLTKPLLIQFPPLSSTLYSSHTDLIVILRYAKLLFGEILVRPELLPGNHFL